ncbi:MAG: SIS domain-containing protein [Chloroflexi bacterium]|nr:MAG: SIS domain-containing protein [Chloroflexota bacterium]
MYLAQEIREQPTIIARLLSEQASAIQQVAEAIKQFAPSMVCIAARGTSDNAARYAKYTLGAFAGLPVMLAAPSLHTIYQRPPKLDKALVIGISQSGQAADVLQVIRDAKAQGALTVGITNYEDSPIAQTADFHLALMAGEERSIAATKTYTAQLTLLAMLTAAVSGDEKLKHDLSRLPQLVDETLALSEPIHDWAERYRYMERFAVIGRGFNYCTAFEISLKVKELCYISANGYSEADFRHGPIATIQHGFPVMLVAPEGAMLPYMHDLTEKLCERGAECLIISSDTQIAKQATYHMPLPHHVPEWLSPIVSVIPGQIFAMQQAVVRGYAVDSPRGLSKVTITQ